MYKIKLYTKEEFNLLDPERIIVLSYNRANDDIMTDKLDDFRVWHSYEDEKLSNYDLLERAFENCTKIEWVVLVVDNKKFVQVTFMEKQ